MLTAYDHVNPMTDKIGVDGNSPASTTIRVEATTTTREGITITGDQIRMCYGKHDHDFCDWGFSGEPSGVRFSMDSPPTPQMTNNATISRIAHIIAAPPGYITTDQLDLDSYIPSLDLVH